VLRRSEAQVAVNATTQAAAQVATQAALRAAEAARNGMLMLSSSPGLAPPPVPLVTSRSPTKPPLTLQAAPMATSGPQSLPLPTPIPTVISEPAFVVLSSSATEPTACGPRFVEDAFPMKVKLGGKGMLAAVPEKNTFIHYDVPGEEDDEHEVRKTVSAPAVVLSATAPIGSLTGAPGTQPGLGSYYDTLAEHIPAPMQQTPKQRNVSPAPSGTCSTRTSSPMPTSSVGSNLTPLSTVGSGQTLAEIAHSAGECKPCAYFWTRVDGCRYGQACKFCHLCNRHELKKRRKQLRMALKAMRAMNASVQLAPLVVPVLLH